MRLEYRRQIIHISGVLFVVLAQVVGREIAIVYFALFAVLFLSYSLMLARGETNRILRRLHFFEPKLRKHMLKFERSGGPKFMGAFLFYLSAAVSFTVFPFPLASAAVAILSVGDGFATLVGVSVGRHLIIPKKTIEGSSAFFFTAILVALFFVPLSAAIVTAAVATLLEIAVGHPRLKPYRNWGIDDNLLVPLVAGLVLLLL